MRRTPTLLTAAVLSLALAGLAGTAARAPDAAASTTTADHTRNHWARLADRVPTPVLRWTTCRKTDQCATAKLPLDYQRPHGAQVKLALLRVRAADPARRLGTIFVNPGGPGDSARDWAALLPQGVPKSILDRFDLVGVDPRGVGGSTAIRCFRTKAQQARTEAPFATTPFPYQRAQQRSWIRAARALGRACSRQRIASAMSTTDDALDMDVLRRAVGDRRLTYFGESGGSYLGEVYANMFPGRIRAVAIDGIVDPQAWVGTRATADVPVIDRMGSAAASYRALRGLLARCQRAGRTKCSFAGNSRTAHTTARFAGLAARLRARPLQLTAPGSKAITFSYANLIDDTEHWMHDPAGYRGLFPELTDLARLAAPGGAGRDHNALVRALLHLHSEVHGPPALDNAAFSGVLCADSRHAANAASWPAAAAAADRGARYFGAYYAWLSVACARDTWTARDHEVYRGPFDRRTDTPVLVIGGRWDPATSYDNAVKVARMMPGSRLVSSDNWGHESAGTSACVDNALFGYLIHPRARAPKVLRCRGDVQPFAG